MTARVRAAALVLAVTLLAALVVATNPGPPLQAVVVGVFLLAAPGAAVLLRERGWPPLVWVTAAVGASIALDVAVSTALFYAGWWTPARVLACLASICVVCAVSAIRTGWAPEHG